MTNSISSFKDNFNGGTRVNRFVVIPTWPQGINPTTNDSTFKIVSASLPSAQINSISIPYRGRMINFAGDRQYSPWTVGVYDDGNTENLWKAFQTWKEKLDGHYTHLVANNDYGYSSLQTTWQVQHLDLNNSGSPLRTITLYKCWPSAVGELALNMGENNFASFSVTLTFDNFKIESQ